MIIFSTGNEENFATEKKEFVENDLLFNYKFLKCLQMSF